MEGSPRTARMGQNKDRQSFFVEFRHPKRLDSQGKLGKKVRRGIGADVEVAKSIVADLQAILNDDYWWTFDRRSEAERKFEQPLAVAIFYDGMEPTAPDFGALRDVIPLPDRKSDPRYAFILPIGPSGAGKSTLDRHLLGTHPEKHRFPATATAKTTTYETEIIVDDGPFEAVVTFLPRDQVRDLIEDCVLAAARARAETMSPNEAARRLMEHTEQRFRMNYILGDLRVPENDAPASEFDELTTSDEDEGRIAPEKHREWATRLQNHLQAIETLAADKWDEILSDGLCVDPESNPDGWEETLDSFEMRIRDDDRFLDIVDDLETDIQKRFELAPAEPSRTRDQWPISCHFRNADQDRFIHSLKVFTSVNSARWGELLTPLVSGLRVKGPFRPDWYPGNELPRWVIFDTEGLGHDPSSATSVPTSITSKYDLVDVVLVVDSAKQAMTHAATAAALRSLASSGHAQKVMICFTHFDLMDVQNLSRIESRQNRLRTSLDNVLANIGKSPAGRSAEMSLRRLVPDRVFFFGHLDQRLDGQSAVSERGVARFTIKEFHRLADAIAKRIAPKAAVVVHPEYHAKHLGFAVQGAADDFHQRWKAILGYESHPGYSKAPWQTLKALTRRLANRWSDHFNGLMPVADFISCLQERLRMFLSRPIRWIDDGGNPVPLDDTMESARDESIDAVVASVSKSIHEMAPRRLLNERLPDWAVAFGRSGPGSTFERMKDMRDIYDSAVPIPTDKVRQEAMDFLDEVAEIVADAVRINKGRMI